jgi:hypothetical protein
MKIKKGATRCVLLIKGYAIKMPRLAEWRLFLNGLLGNMQETVWWTNLKDDKLCPILFSIPGGFLNIMPRVSPISEREYVDLQRFSYPWISTADEECNLPVEWKKDSFGWYQGRIVAIDYGS